MSPDARAGESQGRKQQLLKIPSWQWFPETRDFHAWPRLQGCGARLLVALGVACVVPFLCSATWRLGQECCWSLYTNQARGHLVGRNRLLPQTLHSYNAGQAGTIQPIMSELSPHSNKTRGASTPESNGQQSKEGRLRQKAELGAGLKRLLERALVSDLYSTMADDRSSRQEALDLAIALSKFSAAFSTRRDLAFVTFVAPVSFLSRDIEAVLMTVMYAVQYGYTYIIDTDTSPHVPCPNQSWSVYFNKMLAVKRHLGAYQAILYIDTDAMVYKEPLADVFQRLIFQDEAVSGADFIVADHYDCINVGVMIFRNSNWSRSFINQWWKRSQERGCELFPWGDNHSVYIAMMDMLPEPSSTGAEACPDPRECPLRKWHRCLADQLTCRGFPYNERIKVGRMSILPQDEPLYRINQWYLGAASIPGWKRENYFRMGDIVAHSKNPRQILDPQLFRGRLKQTVNIVKSRCNNSSALVL